MVALMTKNDAPNEWDEGLPEVERYINNSESKVTLKTPFELLHGYRPRFRLGVLRQLTTTSDNWTMPQDLWNEARQQIESSKRKTKADFYKHRHNNTHYSVGEIVVMKRCPNATGESTKLQDRYRGPLVITERLPGDVYRVDSEKISRFGHYSTCSAIEVMEVVQ